MERRLREETLSIKQWLYIWVNGLAFLGHHLITWYWILNETNQHWHATHTRDLVQRISTEFISFFSLYLHKSVLKWKLRLTQPWITS